MTNRTRVNSIFLYCNVRTQHTSTYVLLLEVLGGGNARSWNLELFASNAKDAQVLFGLNRIDLYGVTTQRPFRTSINVVRIDRLAANVVAHNIAENLAIRGTQERERFQKPRNQRSFRSHSGNGETPDTWQPPQESTRSEGKKPGITG